MNDHRFKALALPLALAALLWCAAPLGALAIFEEQGARAAEAKAAEKAAERQALRAAVAEAQVASRAEAAANGEEPMSCCAAPVEGEAASAEPAPVANHSILRWVGIPSPFLPRV